MHVIPFHVHSLKRNVNPHNTLYVNITCKEQKKMDGKREKFMIEAASLEDEREMRKGDDRVTYL